MIGTMAKIRLDVRRSRVPISFRSRGTSYYQAVPVYGRYHKMHMETHGKARVRLCCTDRLDTNDEDNNLNGASCWSSARGLFAVDVCNLAVPLSLCSIIMIPNIDGLATKYRK
jgi:hypothetical protein